MNDQINRLVNCSRNEIEEPNKNSLGTLDFPPEANHSKNVSVQPDDEAFYVSAIDRIENEGGLILGVRRD